MSLTGLFFEAAPESARVPQVYPLFDPQFLEPVRDSALEQWAA